MKQAILSVAFCCVAVLTSPSWANDKDEWEKFPDGSTGKVTEYKGVKDTPIAAYVRKPKGDGPFPVVVMIHGGGESKEGTYALGRMKTAPTANFIAEGWAVYSIDFRPKSPFLPIEWDDACLAVETVKKLPFIDGKRVAMIGGSHGGYNTARVASRCDLSCAIPCAPAAIDLLEVFKAQQAGFKLSPNLERVLKRKEQEYGASMAEVMKDPAKFKHESSLTEVKNVRCPILLISGKNDASSPPSVMETYAKKLKDAGKEVELYLPDNGPHGFYFGKPAIPETDEAAKRAVAFIRKHFHPPAKKEKDDAPQWVTPPVTAPRVRHETFDSAAVKTKVSFHLYTPAEYDGQKERRFPVLYWLHGTGGGEKGVPILAAWFDAAIRAGKTPPMFVVFVNGLPAGMWCDSKDGKTPVETIVIKELIPHLDATFRTIAAREGRIIEGFSMGGYGAARLGFKYHDKFAAVSMLAGGPLDLQFKGPRATANPKERERILQTVYGGDLEYFKGQSPWVLAEQNAAAVRSKTRVRQVIGDRDLTLALNREFDAHLTRLEIPHAFTVLPKVAHDTMAVFDALGEKNWEFYRAVFGKDPKAHKWVDRAAAEKTTAKTLRSDTIKGDVSYVIYLPPSYDKEKDRRYPVVYWLHGGRGSQRDCGKFVEVTDKAIRDGTCPEMIIVGVNGLGGSNEFPGSQYSDWKDGSLPMESVIVKDLLPHIDKTYRTLGTREGRALEGFSMGGHGALHLAFRHPDLFGVVTAIGPALIVPGDGGNRVQWVYEKGAYKGDKEYWLAHDPLTVAEKNAGRIRGKMFIRLITGEVEGNFTHRRTVELGKALEKLKIEHEFVRPGETGHNYAKVYEAMPKGYEFYAKAFGKLTPKAKEPPVPPAKDSKEGKTADKPLAKGADPEPPVCYDITKSYPGEIGQYRVSRAAKPVEPFEIMDGLYYVGNTQVSAHLLTTKDGLVLIDTTMPHEVPWLLASIRKLGFKPSDVKVVIGTHAHIDHIGGHWYFQKHFGAQAWLQVEDAAGTEAGVWKPGKPVDLDGTIGTLSRAFPSFKTDRPLRDGEVVEWGGRKLTFRRAPGHTPGTLMIEFPLESKDGKTYRAGLLGGLSPGRPEFTVTCKKLRELNVAVWLGAHPEQNKTLAKADQLKDGKGPNPFVDPDGWKDFLDRMIARGK